MNGNGTYKKDMSQSKNLRLCENHDYVLYKPNK